MELKLNRKSGIPLYRQVKDLILEKVRTGEISSGFKMPTERVLSEELSLSRNTVSAAYKELEKEGILISKQGKGTFIAEESSIMASKEHREKLKRYVDLSIEESVASGMEPKDLLELVRERLFEKLSEVRRARSVYVECNIEQASYFARQLENETGIECDPLTITDLIEMNDDTRLKLFNSKVIVSTFNHVPEVSEYTEEFGKEVLGLAINPDLNTIVKIARYPKDWKIALICISDEFKEKVKNALERAGLSDLSIEYSNSDDPEELRKTVEGKDMILVSPGRRKEITSMVDENKVQSFIYNLDEGSVNQLKTRLVDLSIL